MVCTISSVKASCFQAKGVSSSNAPSLLNQKTKTHRGRRRFRTKKKSKRKSDDDPVGVFCLGNISTVAGFTAENSKPGHCAFPEHFIKCRSPPIVSDVLIFKIQERRNGS